MLYVLESLTVTLNRFVLLVLFNFVMHYIISTRIYLFADDAKLFKHVICDEDHKALQLGLNALQDWSNKWLLKLNILKCKTFFFGRNINKKKNYTHSLQGTQLERLEHMKDLGVIFDSELNFVQHCKENCVFIFKRLTLR